MKETLGAAVARLRKEKGMTRLEQKMGITDKAVSKWERDLSCPDAASLPRLAEILGITVDQLMQSRTEKKADPRKTVNLVLRAVALAMGVAVTVLTALGEVDTATAQTMLGIGLACGAASLIENWESPIHRCLTELWMGPAFSGGKDPSPPGSSQGQCPGG